MTVDATMGSGCCRTTACAACRWSPPCSCHADADRQHLRHELPKHMPVPAGMGLSPLALGMMVVSVVADLADPAG